MGLKAYYRGSIGFRVYSLLGGSWDLVSKVVSA